MLDIFERLMFMLFGAVVFTLGVMLVNWDAPSLPSNMREACQKQNNVYRCEIVAVPVKGE